MKSGNLNFLEPSGPLQACNGTALPLSVSVEVGGGGSGGGNYIIISSNSSNISSSSSGSIDK